MSIAVVGASGFVGSAFVERLLADGRKDIRALIHSTGNGWRLARHRIALQPVDLLSPRDLLAALEGCTEVVNCSRGPSQVMIAGLRNLIDASRACKVQRFVHLSSIAVYGEAPRPESAHEDAAPQAAPRTYGWTKLQQDRLVEAAVRKGLPCVTLCPPNIIGPYSPFLLEVLGALRKGELVLVEDGRAPCNLVDVENLVHAIKLALVCTEADGRRVFVTDDEAITWAQLVEALAPLASPCRPVASFTRDDAVRVVGIGQAEQLSVRLTVKHLLSSEVRSALAKDPLLGRVERLLKSGVRALPPAVEYRLRERLAGGQSPRRKQVGLSPVATRLVRQQLRGVVHSCERAKQALNYRPVVSFGESMEAFRAWYEALYGWGSPWWSLQRQLGA